MHNWHFPAWAAATKLRAPYDAGGGAPQGSDGGGVDAGAGDDAGADGDPAGGDEPTSSSDDEPRHATGGDDEDDEDADDLTPAERQALEARAEQDPEVRRLLARNKRLIKESKKNRPIARLARGLGITDEATLRDLHLRANAQPRGGTDQPTRERSTRDDDDGGYQPLEDLPPFAYDESVFEKAGWDVGHPQNRALIGEFRSIREQLHQSQNTTRRLVNVLRAQDREIKRLGGTVQGERRSRENASWSEAINAGVAQIRDKELQEEFRYAVYGRYERARQQGQRINPKEVTEQVLRRFVRSGQMTQHEASRVGKAAAAQRVADRNRTQPRAAAMSGAGAPSGAPTVDRSRETLRDIHRKHLGRGFVGALGR